MIGRRVVGRIAALAVTTFVLSTVGVASAAPTAWHEVTSPHVSGNASEIYAMTATGADDVWAFGYDRANIAGTFEWRVLGQHWDGTQWTRLNTLDRETAPAHDFIYGASATATDDVWIVGQSDTSVGSSVSRNLVEHWDGAHWSIDDSVPDPGVRRGLLAVSARTRTDVWAVGNGTLTGRSDYNGFVVHRSAAGWAQVPFALTVPGCNRAARGELEAVSAVAAHDVYVAGWCQSQPIGDHRGFVAHYDGAGWSLVLESQRNSELTQLSVAPGGEVWVGGSAIAHGPNPAEYPLIWHGTALRGWTSVPVRHSLTFQGPLGALSVSAAGVFIAGQLADPHAAPFVSYALRLGADGHWHKEPVVPSGAFGYARLHAAAAEPTGTLWLGGTAVGGSTPDVQSLLARRDS